MAIDIFGNKITRDIFGNPLAKKDKRQSVSRSQKNEILSKQRNKCAVCKKSLDMRATDFDHIKEVYKGGKSRVGNLQALCANCHNVKTHEEKLKKVETRRKTNNSGTGNYFINPITDKKERENPLDWKL